MRAAVVIPNWNGIDYIRDCLDALARQSAPHTVIVVDNGSKDGSMEVVRDEYPGVQLESFPDNAGFAGGVNRGIRPALEQGFEAIALLNNDAVADRDWLRHLVETLQEHPKAGAVTAKITTRDGKRLDSTGDFYTTWGWSFPRGRGEEDRGQYDRPELREVFAVSGGASLYRAEMLRETGLFDERFFAYFEDVDMSFRGRLRGWQMLYEPQATVAHYIGGTSSRVVQGATTGQAEASATGHDRPSAFARYHTVKNFAFVYTKNMPGWLYWRYLLKFWASWAMMVASDARRGLLAANMRANAAVLANLAAVLRDRWRIQRRRRVPPAEIDRLLYHGLPPLQRARFRKLGPGRGARP